MLFVRCFIIIFVLKKEFQQLFSCYPALPSIVHAGSILQPGQRPPAPSSRTALNPDKAGPLTSELVTSQELLFTTFLSAGTQKCSQYLYQLPNIYHWEIGDIFTRGPGTMQQEELPRV